MRYFQKRLEKAAPILIVTAAGGMFGMVIKSTGIGEAAGSFLQEWHWIAGSLYNRCNP